MPGGGSRPGERRGGRLKGGRNKLTVKAREANGLAAAELGGAVLLEWVREDPLNEAVFWTRIFTRLIPVEVIGPKGGPVQVEVLGINRAR